MPGDRLVLGRVGVGPGTRAEQAAGRPDTLFVCGRGAARRSLVVMLIAIYATYR